MAATNNLEQIVGTYRPILSFIVPAMNEEKYIGITLSALIQVNEYIDSEILVVDNGSNDQTTHIAKGYNVFVYELANVSISELRNFGATKADGEILAFIDADVEITQQWRDNLLDLVRRLIDNPLTVTGARCHAATQSNFLDKYWFNRLLEYKSQYINSGNLITSKKLFECIKGFDANLTTSEDHDFCQRAAKAGGTILEQRSLVAIHHGYPTTILGFVRREMWHGRADFNTFRSILHSKVAIIAVLNILVLAITIGSSVQAGSILFLVLYPAFIAILSLTLTLYRYNFNSTRYLLATSLLFSLYLWGRSLAFLKEISKICSPR